MTLSNLNEQEVKDFCKFIKLDEFKKSAGKVKSIKTVTIRELGKSPDRIQKSIIDQYILEHEIENFDVDNDDIIYLISNPGIVALHNGKVHVKIIYDTPLKRSNDAMDHNQYVTVNSKHNRPDFIVSFNDSEDNLLDTKIIEAKWRPLSSIYNELDDTDVVETLKEYFNLGYHDHKRKKTKRGVVSQVFVVYPDSNEVTINIQNDEILAIGTMPINQANGTNAYCLFKSFLTTNSE